MWHGFLMFQHCICLDFLLRNEDSTLNLRIHLLTSFLSSCFCTSQSGSSESSTHALLLVSFYFLSIQFT
ncbi:hypothetical protein O6H91_10G030100 [Diphasiastrum complanatum]|uniref:Uncharacterized protein n=1 Tax=Diphasiastrum complanatum TaxID=34168 RepID=A0ACC2CFV6_DIPCM|nr:hypothetical protein O6H91_10G030100 [Diphasiastrum complanatum]